MGSNESHFNVSLIMKDKVTRPCPQTTAFEEKGEPKRTEPRSLCLLGSRVETRTKIARSDCELFQRLMQFPVLEACVK